MLDADDALEVARVLRAEGMPEHEIHRVLDASDARLVHRSIELHAELLEERLAHRRRALARLEYLLIESRSA